MIIESQQAAHKAATEILNAAEKQDDKFHYVLLTTHEGGTISTCSSSASSPILTKMLSISLAAKDLTAALYLALEK